MFYTIYKITCKTTGKIYIGKHQTKNLDDGYMGSGKYLKRAQSKYGLESFTKEILHIFETEVEMNAKEAELVTEEFCSSNDTFNICPGGQGGWGYINQNCLNFGGFEGRSKGGKKNNYTPLSNPNLTHEEKVRIIIKREKTKKLKYAKDYLTRNATIASMSKECIKKKKEVFKNIKHAQGSKNSQYGTMWITNGSENKKIKKNEEGIYLLPEGWYKGRVTKFHSSVAQR